MIDILEFYCSKYCLTVNQSKTKIMMFKNGGIRKLNETWRFKNEEIGALTAYKYSQVPRVGPK